MLGKIINVLAVLIIVFGFCFEICDNFFTKNTSEPVSENNYYEDYAEEFYEDSPYTDSEGNPIQEIIAHDTYSGNEFTITWNGTSYTIDLSDIYAELEGYYDDEQREDLAESVY